MVHNFVRRLVLHTALIACLVGLPTVVQAAEEPPATPAASEQQPPSEAAPAVTEAAAEGASGDTEAAADTEKASSSALIPLTKENNLWIDPKRKLVVMDGEVCLREGQLEMFVCPKGSKEHESVISVPCKPQHVHAALLAVGAVPGRPVQFDPVYASATGTEIEILILWKDADGTKHKVRAQEWIKNVRTDKPMEYNWVFAGSGFWTDEQSGERLYYGDGGDFICVSNFATATLDVPVESSQANADLLFVANTEEIPPLRTKVRLVLIPKPAKAAATPKPVVKDTVPGASAQENGQ